MKVTEEEATIREAKDRAVKSSLYKEEGRES